MNTHTILPEDIAGKQPGHIIMGDWVGKGYIVYTNGVTSDLASKIRSLNTSVYHQEKKLNDPRAEIATTDRRIFELHTIHDIKG